MKVGICGKMASGKTTLAKGFNEEGLKLFQWLMVLSVSEGKFSA